jgi:hypothetical protein
MFAYMQCDWLTCYHASTTALAIKDRVLVYTCDPAVWGAKPHDLAAIAAWHMGMFAEANKHGREALALDPENERLQRNVEHYATKDELIAS